MHFNNLKRSYISFLAHFEGNSVVAVKSSQLWGTFFIPLISSLCCCWKMRSFVHFFNTPSPFICSQNKPGGYKDALKHLTVSCLSVLSLRSVFFFLSVFSVFVFPSASSNSHLPPQGALTHPFCACIRPPLIQIIFASENGNEVHLRERGRARLQRAVPLPGRV